MIESTLRPDGVTFYLFGSILSSKRTSDIDMLCIYGNSESASEVYAKLNPFFDDIQNWTGQIVHPVILSESEEREIMFVKSESATPIFDG